MPDGSNLLASVSRFGIDATKNPWYRIGIVSIWKKLVLPIPNSMMMIVLCLCVMYFVSCCICIEGTGLNFEVSLSNRPDHEAQLAEHWASIPMVVGSIPSVVRHIVLWCYTEVYPHRTS